MIYTLLTKDDILAIEKILVDSSIKYKILINEDLISEQNETMKQVVETMGQTRRTNACYNLQIDKNEFDKIHDEKKKELEKYNIFPELTDSIFQSETHRISSPLDLKEEKHSWYTRFLAVLVLLFILCFCVAYFLG